MNRRLPLSTFAVCSALLLTGCAKTVSKEDAEKFIEENYTSTEEKEMKIHSVSNVEKAEGIYEKLMKVGKEENDTTAKVAPIKKAELSVYSADYFEFKVQGKKLIIEYSLKGDELVDMLGSLIGDSVSKEDFEIKGSASAKMIYDENGYPVSSSEKCDMNFKYSKSGFSVEGALKMTEEITYSFK